MQIKKIITLFYFLLLTGIFAFPQYGNVNGRRSNANFEANLSINNILRSRNVLQDVINRKNYTNILTEVIGEPYFEKIFLQGNIYYKDSLDLGRFLMRYNAYLDEMEVSNPDGPKFINKIDSVSIILNDIKYVLLDYVADDITVMQGFFI